MDKVDDILTRGVEKVLPSKESLGKLMNKRKIKLYQGFDPSSENLHLGNLIGIRKLAQFQKLGHKVIFLIGDFTGMIGDPTDKKATRKKLTKNQVVSNAKDYKNQISNILSFKGENKAEIMYNSSWLSKLKFEEIVDLASNFTAQQMLERDFFQRRLDKRKPIYLHEFLYPIMQGFDSVKMGVDLEIGGNDQLFNMLAGRSLMKILKNKEKFVLTMKLLEDPTGKKMGKTEGLAINLTDSNVDIFGKIMALPDGLIDHGIELLTDLPLKFAEGKKPLEAKKGLAFEVAKQVHGEVGAKEAQEHFEKTHQKGEFPRKTGQVEPADLTTTVFQGASAVVGSRSQAKRLIQQGAVDVSGKTVTDPSYMTREGEKIKIGKRTFVKVRKK